VRRKGRTGAGAGEQTEFTVVRTVMASLASVWPFVLPLVFCVIAAHFVAAAVLNWFVCTRRHRSPVRRWALRRFERRLARAGAQGDNEAAAPV